jgi:hypothetical protein
MGLEPECVERVTSTTTLERLHVGDVASNSGQHLVERRRPGRPTKDAARMPVRIEMVICVFFLFFVQFFLMILYR